jgi:uncharacterized membrane protein
MSNGPITPKPDDEPVEPRSSEPIPPSDDSSTPEASGSVQTRIRARWSASFAGPLPPPDILRGYEEVLPGAAQRIIAMAENQQSHRTKIESAVIQENCKSQRRGLTYGFVITMTAIIGGIFLVYEGKNTAGLVSIL